MAKQLPGVKTLTLSANGASDWLYLPKPVFNTVNVDCPTWAGSSVAIEHSKDGSDANAKPFKDSDGQFVATENDGRGADCAGWLRAVVSSYGGTPIVFSVDG